MKFADRLMVISAAAMLSTMAYANGAQASSRFEASPNKSEETAIAPNGPHRLETNRPLLDDDQGKLNKGPSSVRRQAGERLTERERAIAPVFDTSGASFSDAARPPADLASVPETRSVMMLIAGLGLMGFVMRRRRPQN